MQEKKSLTVKQKKIAAGCALAVFILLSAAVFWFVGRPMIRFVRQPELFQQWVDGLGFWGKAAYVGMCILQVVVAIIPGEPLEICGGYAFGGVWGSVLCMLGLFLAGAARGGDLLFPGETGEAAFSQALPQAEFPVLAGLYHSRHSQGPVVLFCGFDGCQLGNMAAAMLRRAAAVGADLHRRWQCVGRQELPVCRSGIRRNTGFLPGGSADLPQFVPKAREKGQRRR